MPVRTIDPVEAIRHLTAADPVMAGVIASGPPFALREDGDDPFRSLARAIIYQQLSGTAAGTIFRRFAGLFDGGDTARAAQRLAPGWTPFSEPFPAPAAVLALSDEAMRAAGLSRQKTAALRSLAEHFAAGDLGAHAFAELDDDAIVERVTQVRGVGRWTAEMFLLFHLRRADVLPVNDIGINRAIRRLYALDAMPRPADVLRIGEPWRPWASVACWYLWRSEDVKTVET
ncbi:MAG: DNA-3-methyladenine glycosylase 2 family protein [Dehalococcoidia bacterium]|nr:DNA-3-methyladenine glycosylase 2 family protein [Dehalococcoidia bacterium]